ncbi:lysosome membrane protein 2-like [Amphiura filiformis]|uniref:lysosome membrane protein 2-like n=1 Tax=Amphiura filiformis TaxID=82378 RepID=UPI003B21130E
MVVAASSKFLTTANKIALFLLFLGGAFCIVGYLKTPPLFDKILTDVIHKILKLTPNSEIYETWVNPDIPVYQRFYFFDIQNKEEIMKGGKPNMTEVGPYTYSVLLRPANISFEGNSTVSFRKHLMYTFEPELSVGLEDDIITTVNFPFATAASGVKSESWFARLAVSAVAKIHKQEIFTKISVRDLLWGYQDPLLKQLQNMVGEDMISSDEFGLLLGKNNTIDKDVYTINTGEADTMLLNTIEKFNGMESVQCWGDETANMINGTDGMFFHPFIDQEEILYVFNPFLFRSLPYEYQGDNSYKGVPIKDFTVPPYAYANPSEYPANAGFCLSEPCAPTGILDISSCAMGVPLALSNPHFLYGAEDITQSIDGLHSNESLHQSRMGIEPIMGIPYIFDQRVQINYYLEETSGIGQTEGIPSLYYPMVWLDTHGEMPDSVVSKYKQNIAGTYKMVEMVLLSCIVSGSIICFCIISIAALALLRFHRSRNQNKKNVANNNTEIKKAEKEKFINQISTNNCNKNTEIPWRKQTNGTSGYKPVAVKHVKEETTV